MNAKEIAAMDFARADHESPDYDVEVDTYLGSHFVELIGLETMRTGLLVILKEKGLAQPGSDGCMHPTIETRSLANILRGMKSANSRFTRTGRYERLACESLRQELLMHSSMRVDLVPPKMKRGLLQHDEA